MSNSRARRLAYYGLPMLFCLAVHFLALKMWFFKDDFAWLGLRLEVHRPADLIPVLFSPQAEGTIRTLSERLFFLVFSSVFGLNAPPFRVWALLTQFANLALLMAIARRLTGSRSAAVVAALLWTANASLALAISWSAAYNEIAFAFFVLLAFWLFLRYIDTGQRKYWIWEWVVFLLGFGALELNVVYPALAAGYALCCARPFFRKSLLLFIPSVLFTVLHFLFVPRPTDPYYVMHFDSGLAVTLWEYWVYGLGAVRIEDLQRRTLSWGLATALLASVALAVFLYRKLRRREWLALYLPGWFLVVVLPLLPLKNHVTEYYLTVPTIGLAILAGWAVASSSWPITRAAAVLLCGLYLTASIADIYSAEHYFYVRSRRMKYLIKGLESQQKIQPHKTVVLQGIDNELFWTGFCDDPFRLVGLSHTYLAPGSEQNIQRHPEWGCDVSIFFLRLDDAIPMLRHHEASVFTLQGRRLVDITQPYLDAVFPQFLDKHPEFVDIGDPAYGSRLGPTWFPPEQNYRWMPKTATVKIGGPKKAGQKLVASGFCPAALLAQGPLKVSFRADGVDLGAATLSQPDRPFQLEFPLPPELIGKALIEVEIEVSRTVHPPNDTRSLGLVFTTFNIK